jgi:hypothetical protein
VTTWREITTKCVTAGTQQQQHPRRLFRGVGVPSGAMARWRYRIKQSNRLTDRRTFMGSVECRVYSSRRMSAGGLRMYAVYVAVAVLRLLTVLPLAVPDALTPALAPAALLPPAFPWQPAVLRALLLRHLPPGLALAPVLANLEAVRREATAYGGISGGPLLRLLLFGGPSSRAAMLFHGKDDDAAAAVVAAAQPGCMRPAAAAAGVAAVALRSGCSCGGGGWLPLSSRRQLQSGIGRHGRHRHRRHALWQPRFSYGSVACNSVTVQLVATEFLQLRVSYAQLNVFS